MDILTWINNEFKVLWLIQKQAVCHGPGTVSITGLNTATNTHFSQKNGRTGQEAVVSLWQEKSQLLQGTHTFRGCGAKLSSSSLLQESRSPAADSAPPRSGTCSPAEERAEASRGATSRADGAEDSEEGVGTPVEEREEGTRGVGMPAEDVEPRRCTRCGDKNKSLSAFKRKEKSIRKSLPVLPTVVRKPIKVFEKNGERKKHD